MTPDDIQAAFASGVTSLIIPTGKYIFPEPWKLPQGCNVFCEPGSFFKWAFTEKKNAIEFSNSNHLTAYGCIFQMNWISASPLPANDSDDGLLFIKNVTGIIIKGGNYVDAFIDGIFIRNASTVILQDIIISTSRRNGLSVTNGRNIIINSCVFKESRGLSPQAGVCIEPNDISDQIQNITFNNCQCLNNASHEYLFNFSKFTSASMQPIITLNKSPGRLDVKGFSGQLKVT